MILYNKINQLWKNIHNEIKGVNLMRKGAIQAVHYDNLIEFLESIEEYERVVSGHAKCYFCNSTITLDNIQSIFPLDNEVKYCCNDESCYSKLVGGSNLDA